MQNSCCFFMITPINDNLFIITIIFLVLLLLLVGPVLGLGEELPEDGPELGDVDLEVVALAELVGGVAVAGDPDVRQAAGGKKRGNCYLKMQKKTIKNGRNS